MFNVITVDGHSIIDTSAVQDPQTERLRVTVMDGRVYSFQLVNGFLVIDPNQSDEGGIEHARAAYCNVRPVTPELQIYIPTWNARRPFETHQPTEGKWLYIRSGVIPAPKHVTGVRHALLGGPVTAFSF